MRFHYLPQIDAPPESLAFARKMAAELRECEFDHPMDLMDTLREHSTEHKLGLTVAQVNGTVCVQQNSRIVLRITPVA